MSRADDLRKLIATHTRKLQKLNEQKASLGGLHVAPHILTEIEDTEAEIEHLQAELAKLENAWELPIPKVAPASPTRTKKTLLWIATHTPTLVLGIVIGVVLMLLIPAQNIVIDPMEELTGWEVYGNGEVVVGQVEGQTKNAAELSYTLGEYEYVGLAKSLLPCQLAGTKGLQVSYNGSGVMNTIEFKVIYTPDTAGQEAVFSRIYNHSSATNKWVTVEVPYSEFNCWPETGCRAGEPLNISKVGRIEIAVSNKPEKNDIPGAGVMLLDDIQAFK